MTYSYHQEQPMQEPYRQDAKHRHGHHVYGGKAALYVREDTDRKGRQTITFEVASRKQGGYTDWNEKLSLQLTAQELVGVAAVLLGLMPKCEYSMRGRTGKGFSIKRQENAFFIQIWEKTSHHLRMQPADAANIVQLLIGRLIERNGTDGTAVLASIRAFAQIAQNSPTETH